MGDLRHFSPKSKSIVSFVNGKTIVIMLNAIL